jgi:hypothetical protein
MSKAVEGDRSAIHLLFLKSQNKSLDGESSELYSVQLYLLLHGLGSQSFFHELKKEKIDVQTAVENRIGRQ